MAMPRNRILYVESIRQEYTRGLPDGLNEEFIRRLPILFERIEELERVIAPFAKQAIVEKPFGKEMVSVYRADCERALAVVDRGNAAPVRKIEELEYPA